MSWSRLRRAIFTACLFLGLAASPVLAATYSVTITDDQFVPSTLKIQEGDSVTFINSTDATQSAKTTLTSGFNTGNIAPGASKTVTLDTAGTYSYSSVQDSTLTGTITVASDTLNEDEDSTTSAKGGVSTTQDMPVSGTVEILMAMILGGAGLITFGLYTGRLSLAKARQETLVELPSISSYNENQDGTDSHRS